ncbi:MAG: 4-(cytidine 5'-diphospho)-2-C-methyl-D-erythritol kinase [Candidatus Eisenbacteria bacterium]
MELTVLSYGKLNLFLEILGRASDGYHELSTVMQTVSIADTLRFEEAEGLEVTADGPDVPDGEGNLVWKAAVRLREESGVRRGARIRIEKGIPAAAGLGGGSGDAAAALVALARLWGVRAPLEDLIRIGSELGSDVPFFFYGGTRLCEGRGEIVSPWPPIPQSTRFLVVTPDLRLSTSFVYEEFERRGLTGGPPSSNLKRVPGGISDPGLLLRSLFNRLEEAVLPTCPSLREMKGRMGPCCPGGVFMSGSGPTLFGVLPPTWTEEEGFRSRFADARFAAIARPTSSGYRILPQIDTGLSKEGGEHHGDQ